MRKPEDAANEIAAKRAGFEGKRKESLINRFKLFLVRESAMGDDQHPAARALEAIEAGNIKAAALYLEAEIERTKAAKDGTDDETVKARLDVRRSDLERWKESLI